MRFSWIGYIILIALSLTLFAYYTSTEDIVIKVIDKERITTDTENKYLIFTENEVFENTDDILLLKFNSSDIYGKLRRGSTYRVRVVGWRIPALSAYRNIIKIHSIVK